MNIQYIVELLWRYIMSKTYVVQGATLKCSFGDQKGSLQVPQDHRTTINGKPQANIMDYQPLQNIKPFGKCKSRANPTVAAATAANRGRLKPMPCVPATVTPWMNGKTDNLVGNFPALTNKSTCLCRWKGKIEVTEDGQ